MDSITVLSVVSTVAFMCALACAVAAGVIFVKLDVLAAIHFLQGRRVGELVGSYGSRRGRSALVRRARRTPRDDAASKADVLSHPPVADLGSDAPTTVVAQPKQAGQREGMHVDMAARGVLYESAEASEYPTDILSMGEEVAISELPTGLLDDAAEAASELPTGLIGGSAASDSDAPTTVLGDAGAPGATAAPGVAGAPADADHVTEVLSAPAPDEESSEYLTEELTESETSEQMTDLLSDGSGTASGARPPRAPEASGAAAPEDAARPQPAGTGVEQQKTGGFRFKLKQNVLVVHTDDTLGE
ncbi:hypothetical protein [Enorma phocaeensis]|uniref:hypothetical protein n=1 Tax=Enorma phocaeensis TaxID=1871019 RepID=UPI000C84EC33|nr:hypothetical protein [Enorma phocaeensis]